MRAFWRPKTAAVAREELTLTLGTTIGKGKEAPLVLVGKEAAKHKHVMGITGSGKSMLLATLVLQLLNQSVPVALLDPHGDMCDTILQILIDQCFYPDSRAYQRLCYVDFT